MPRPSRKQLDNPKTPLPAMQLDRSRKVSDQIYDWLRGAILSLDLPPGAQLSEFELGVASGLSRTPVREALKRLEVEGLVVTYPSLGYVVSRIDVGHVEQAIVMRALLEGEAAARAAASAEHHAVGEELGRLVEEQARALAEEDLPAVYACDERFHEQLFARTGLDLLWEVVRQARMGMRRLRMLTTLDPANRSTALKHHRALASAIISGDPEGARAQMTAHVLSNRAFLERVRDVNPDYVNAGEQ